MSVSQTNRQIPAHISENISLEEILTDLETLVNVESPSHNVAALNKSAQVLSSVIEKRLGTKPVLVESEVGPHLHWKGGPDAKVVLIGHHDTVFEVGTLAQRPFCRNEETLTGPGVYDMKSGLCQAIHAVAALDKELASQVEILINCDEEVGSAHSRELIEERAQHCGHAMVFEPSGPGGAIKVGRKGCGTFTVTIKGLASHAGLEPEVGHNALTEAAHQILRINELENIEAGTTVNPTVAHVGTADNVIPALGVIHVDARALDPKEAVRVNEAMAALVPVDPNCEIEVTGGIHRPPMKPETSQKLLAIAQELQPGIVGVTVGGGSDGNFTAALGIPTLDGLGPEGGGAHGVSEHVKIDSILPRTELAAAVIERILTDPADAS